MNGPRGSVLIVDDETYVRDSLAALLQRRGFDVRTAAGIEQAMSHHDVDGIDVLVTDLKMPGGGGIELMAQIRAAEPRMPIIVVTGHGSVASAVDCMRAGAFDYLQKPVDPEEMVLVLDRALAHSGERRQLDYLRQPPSIGGEVEPIGASAGWRQAVDQARRVAGSDAPVLLLGETGTGKGELAALIHRASPRAGAAFVEVNCAAVPTELFEAEFFGHRKGAFTGAVEDREGRFRVAHRGTILLDEVDCLAPPAQAKVLRVLERGHFERVGDSKATTVDVRLISATNRDLKAEVDAGRFREDLWYRVNVMTIRVPPLRDRPADILLLAEAFLKRYSRRLGRPVRTIDPATLECLRSYAWPGNVRELRNVIERGVLLAEGGILTVDLLPIELRGGGEAGNERADGGASDLRSRLLAAEKRILLDALQRTDGVKRRAAELLGIDERNMSYYLKKHGLR